MPQVAECFTSDKAIAALESGKIVVFGGGTGNPIFSTDTASALRALEIGADAMLKATMVDGVYDKDPHKYADAVRYDTLTFTRVLGSMAAGCVLTLVYSLLSAKYNVISIQVQPKHYLVLLGMGAVASVLGILGDLFASSVKRQVGIKDYGTIFPGHGGILDRFDSVMFIAPFVSIAVRYFFYLL